MRPYVDDGYDNSLQPYVTRGNSATDFPPWKATSSLAVIVREPRAFLRGYDHDDLIRERLPGDATSRARAGRVADILAAFVKRSIL